MPHNDNSDATASKDTAHLLPLGWSDFFQRQFEQFDKPLSQVARIISVQRDLFLVTDGQSEWLCSPAGRLRRSTQGEYPVTGDWVTVDQNMITGVFARKSFLSRGEAGSGDRSGGATRRQAIAANLDTVFIVCGLDRDYNLRRLERALTLVYNASLAPVVVLTKADLHEDSEPFRLEAESVAWGAPVVLTSSVDNRGIPDLESHLGHGRTIAMIGSSGAGKSTLANILFGSDIRATGEVSDAVGKGRHTTTTRELIRMPRGGLLMDNPGIREIAFYEDGDGMAVAFADIHELAAMCRFADCSHESEPGCAVRRAVADGELPGGRLESFHKMQREMRYAAARSEKSADRVEKERWKDIKKHIRRMNKNAS